MKKEFILPDYRSSKSSPEAISRFWFNMKWLFLIAALGIGLSLLGG